MSIVSIVLVCDGTSDICIQDIIQWIVDEHFSDRTFRIQAAREVIPAHTSLDARIRRANEIYEPDVVVCHRDAENDTLAQRLKEIGEAATIANITKTVVPAIPIRMVESWLLIDSSAIRSAANNKNGTQILALPTHMRIESSADPKNILFTALSKASGLPPQRLKRFDVHKARSRITGYIDSFAPLRHQTGFVQFEQDLVAAVRAIPL